PSIAGQGVRNTAPAEARAAAPSSMARGSSSPRQPANATAATQNAPITAIRLVAGGRLFIIPPGTDFFPPNERLGAVAPARRRRTKFTTRPRPAPPAGGAACKSAPSAQEAQCAADNGRQNRVRANLRPARTLGALKLRKEAIGGSRNFDRPRRRAHRGDDGHFSGRLGRHV